MYEKKVYFGIFLNILILLYYHYECMLLGTPEEAYVYTVTMFGLYFRVFLCKILECLENVTKIVYVNAASKCYLKM